MERNRFKFGARTTMKFNPKLRLNGYAAYGSKNQEYKYSGGFEYYFSKKPKDYLSVQYKHDYEIFGKSKNAFMIDNILNTLLNRSPYNKLNMQEFVSDTYLSVFLEHHFQGYFLNKIPLFRKLKWRELVGVRSLIGSYDPIQHTSMVFPTGMKGLQNTPYTEFSLGLENVFKVFKIVGIWRYNKFDETNSKFGVVGTLQLVL